ncbi:hypothetical protein F5Y09DRAFT_340676 [Xylaria sp. FL1042]|nr:hypothetical protein F5Y09DRAFT_340676 [Xylaria sp. FL1042]
MDMDLQQILEALRRQPQELDEATQRRFVRIIAIDPVSEADRETVETLMKFVTNLDLRLALRLAIWYMDHRKLFRAARTVERGSRNRAERITGIHLPMARITQVPLSRLRETEKELDLREEEEG